jgi:hypothetical protein
MYSAGTEGGSPPSMPVEGSFLPSASQSKSSVIVGSVSEYLRDCGKESIEGEGERGLLLDMSKVIIT